MHSQNAVRRTITLRLQSNGFCICLSLLRVTTVSRNRDSVLDHGRTTGPRRSHGGLRRCAMGGEAWGGSMRRRLTGRKVVPRVSLAGQDFPNPRLTRDWTFDSDAYFVHSRDVSLLQHVRRHAGVFLGIESEAISGSRRPTRQTARWVSCWAAFPDSFGSFKRQRWRSG